MISKIHCHVLLIKSNDQLVLVVVKNTSKLRGRNNKLTLKKCLGTVFSGCWLATYYHILFALLKM